MNLFEIKNGKYALVDQENGKIHYDTDKIAIGFSIDNEKMWTMHYIGKLEIIRPKIQNMKYKFNEAGFNEMADSLNIIEFDNIPVDEVNKCIEITGYIKRFFEKFSEQKED